MPALNTLRTVTIRQVSEGADKVRSDLDGLVSAQQRVAQASEQTATVTEMSSRRQLSAAAAFDKMRAAIDPAFRAQQQFERGVRTLDRALAQGIVDNATYGTTLAQMRDKYEVASAAAIRHEAAQRGAAKAAISARDAMQAATEAAARQYQTGINQTLGVRGDFGGAQRAADFEAAAAAADRLRGKYDQVYAAAQTYGATLTEINALQRAGVITADLASAARERETLSYEKQVYAMGAAARQTAVNSQRNIGLNLGFREAPDVEGRGADMLAAIEAQDRLRAKYDLTFAAEQKLAAATKEINALQASGGIDAARAAQAIQAETDAYNKQIAVLNGTTAAQERLAKATADGARSAAAGWGQLSQAGRRQMENVEATARLSSMGAAASGASPAGRRLRQDEATNLMYQGGDIVAQLGSGSGLGMIAMQQGPQIAQVFAGPGGASVKGAFAQAGEAAAGLVARIGIAGGAFGAIAAVVLAGVAAFVSYDNAQKELQRNLSGVGKAAGSSAAQINAIAVSAASGAGLSVRETRSMAGEFAATGKIGSGMYAALVGSAKDYAATTGQELPAATKALAAAFADPTRGADALNAQLGFLNDTTRENIQRLQAQGDRLGAQKAFFDAYKTSLTSASELTSGWGRITAATGNLVSDAWDKAGRSIDKAFTGGNIDQQLSIALKLRAEAEKSKGFLFGILDGNADAEIARLTGVIASLQARIQKRADEGATAQRAAKSLEVNNLVTSYNPLAEQLKKLQDDATRIKTELAGGVLDPAGNSRRTMEGLLVQAKQLSTDMAAGGAAYADAIARAKFDQRTVGFSPTAKSAADINEDARVKGLNALREAGNNAASEAYLKAAQSIEQVRVTELQTLSKQTTFDQNAIGGAFSRMSQGLQQQIIAAATNPKYGQVTPSLIAGIAGHESTNNPNVGYSKILGEDGRRSSAYGLGQITKGTAEEASRLGYLPPGYDRTDTATMAQGIAAVLQMKIDQNGGSVDRGIMAYRGSNDPGTNRAYLADVKRRAGEMGDVSPLALAKDQDALSRAQRDAGLNVENLTKYYGTNGRALELAQAQQAKYTELLDRGVPAQEAASIAYGDLIKKTVEFGQSAKMVQFAADNQFNREQLGRTASDQNAYAQARSRIGDTSSPAAQKMISDIKETNDLIDAKNQASTALSGFAQDLAHGATAAQAAASALSRLADSVLNKVIDSVVSSAFGSVAKGGLASLFPFADGGIMTSAGPLPLHSYATGGIAKSPQLALFGEGRGPEAFVPLPDGKRIPVAMSQPANMNAGGSVSVNHAPTYNVTPATGVTPEQLAAVVDRNNRDFANRLPGLIKEADRRRA